MPKRTNFFTRSFAQHGGLACLFVCVLFASSAAVACTAPLGINHEAPPPKNEQVVTSVVGEITLAFVPYAQGAQMVEYRVWALDKNCQSVSVPVEETPNNGTTRENGLACVHFTVNGDAVQCTVLADKVVGYHYAAGGLQADTHAPSKTTGKSSHVVSGKANGSGSSPKMVVYSGKKGKGS